MGRLVGTGRYSVSDELLAKVLRAIQNADGITLTDIIIATHVNHASISYALRELRDMNCITFERAGRVTINWATNHQCYYCG